MIAWLLEGLWWVAVGFVLGKLISTPWLDDPVRKGWAWIAGKVGLR